MIPKVIHYCWFGGNPLPESAKKCIDSWKKYMPGYTIKEWNENNFNVHCCRYVEQAYEKKNGLLLVIMLDFGFYIMREVCILILMLNLFDH